MSAPMDKAGRKKTHGMSKSPEYSAWKDIKQRCYNVKNERFNNYGGRGITVCERWISSFLNFYNDIGPRPSKEHSVDRIDNNGNYSPENVRWATRSQQQKNKRPFKLDHKLPRGKNHWTNKNKEKAISIAIKNIKNAHGRLENNPNSKMTKEKAIQMRQMYKNKPNITFCELGKHFGVKRETARKVIRDILW